MILTARRSEIECELSWWSSMTTARRAWSAFALQETGPGGWKQRRQEVDTQRRADSRRWLRQSRRALEFLLVGSLQRSKAARLPGDWPEERVRCRLEDGRAGGVDPLGSAELHAP